ncbi:YidB family protein [Streptomyces albidochromogenes]|uniref:YidB family protein n=1 Tax=Streptomyces albidochromogenes TaxID=329524 RepID=UPI00110FD29C|nr:YidB family protein [Streptomyces albidochromogenes]
MAGEDLGRLFQGLLGSGDARAGLLGSLLDELGGSTAGTGNPLDGLLAALGEGGLGHQAHSWVAAGPNEPVDGTQLVGALPPDTLDEVGRRAGLTAAEAADQLAQVLPEAVDRLTPGGQLPHDTSLEDLIKSHTP